VQWLPRYPALQTVPQPLDSLLPAETADTGALTFLPLPSAAAAASDDAHALCELSALISRAVCLSLWPLYGVWMLTHILVLRRQNAQHAALARSARWHSTIIASAPATDLQRQSRRSKFALRNLPWPHRVSAVRQSGPATATYHFDSASSNSLFSIQPSSLYDGGITSYSFRPPQRAPPPLADAIPSALPELPDVVIVVPKAGTPQQPHTVERQPQSETPLPPPPPVLSAAMELPQKVESRDISDLSGDGGREALLADLVSDNPMARLKRRTVEPAAIISAESPKAAAITNTLPAPSTGGDSGDAHTTLMAAILAGPAKLRPPRPRAPSATSELRKQPQPPREALLDSIRAAGGRAKGSLQQQPATASTTSGESAATEPHDVMAALSASLARRRASVAAPQGCGGSDEDW
jgi:hypothetical protein